jgi:hypothetical protein
MVILLTPYQTTDYRWKKNKILNNEIDMKIPITLFMG